MSFPDISQRLKFSILEHALSECPCQSDVRLLLLCRGVYNFLLPKFYHSFQFGTQRYNAYDVNARALLSSANPKSILLIRQLRVGGFHRLDGTKIFAPFSQLTHLSFWDGSIYCNHSAIGIQDLPLEELIMWNMPERRKLLPSVTSECTLSRTLRRLGSSDPLLDEFEGLKVCTRLTHILTFYTHECGVFDETHVQAFLGKARFICWIVIPRMRDMTEDEFIQVQRMFQSFNDPRIVLVKQLPQHIASTGIIPSFWHDQSALWTAAQKRIISNSEAKDITVIDKLM
ncbi:hypothetical protein DL96DRAFT_1821581 [Flagelloscypha sp. PMI_526]|nr:hypothetical protein DL96DRAFT_1821581 [Flagelloscypha sp. PMI_526]